jgi:hypothetical protein
VVNLTKTLFIFFLILILVAGFVAAAGGDAQMTTGVNALDIQYNEFDSVQLDEYHTFFFHIFRGYDGYALTKTDTVNCSFHLYNDQHGEHLIMLTSNAFVHTYDIVFNVSDKYFTELGEYAYVVQCVCDECGMQGSDMGGYLAYSFDVTTTGSDDSESMMPVAAIILLPMLLGIIFIISIISLGDDHAILKIFLFLLTPILFWVSLHIGLVSVIKFHSFPALQELLSSTAYWSGITFFILLVYFLLYLFIKAVRVAAQEKKERSEY